MDVFKEAEWIDPELPHGKDERQPASVLRRSFTVPQAEETDGPARLFITCHGLYEAMINGNQYTDNKQLLVIEGASHTDLYDGGENNAIPFDKLEAFYNEYLR